MSISLVSVHPFRQQFNAIFDLTRDSFYLRVIRELGIVYQSKNTTITLNELYKLIEGSKIDTIFNRKTLLLYLRELEFYGPNKARDVVDFLVLQNILFSCRKILGVLPKDAYKATEPLKEIIRCVSTLYDSISR